MPLHDARHAWVTLLLPMMIVGMVAAGCDAGWWPFGGGSTAADSDRDRDESDRRAIEAASNERAARARRDGRCVGCDLVYADLRGADLSGIDLSDATLTSVSAAGADLRGADLAGAVLGGDFSGADFRGATLHGVSLSTVDLRGARFEDVDLSRVGFLQRGDWTEAKLAGATLERARFYGPGGTVKRRPPTQVFSVGTGGAVMVRADLRRAVLADAVLDATDLRGADLSDAVLRGAHVSGADLRDADLRRADLSGAKLFGTDLRGADLTGATVDGALLRGDQPETAALLGGATWVDGTRCPPDARGGCRRPAP